MNLRHQLKLAIADKPSIYRLYIRILQPGKKSLIIGEQTEMVIEGFPRSANTYAVVAFRVAQAREVTIAHHTHVPATVIEGYERSLPVLLLIRDPMESVSSASVFTGKPPVALLREWLWFYRACIPYRQHYVLARFEEVISDYGQVIDRVNRQFSKNFQLFRNELRLLQEVEESVERIAARFGQGELQVARPSENREVLKHQAKRQLSEEAAMLEDAIALYNEYVG